MSLTAEVRTRVGTLDVAVELTVSAGETVAVLGPNGAGKTTLLRVLAGLHGTTNGRVVLDGTVLDDTDQGICVPPELRAIGYVFSDLRLFPHLDATDNIAFGLRNRGRSRTDARREAHRWLDRFDLAAVANRKPPTLSGGEAQRVALARALATDPALLLLDEPLAALDAAVRIDARRTLRDATRGSTRSHIVVSHDPVDAATLADRIVVIEGGRVVQTGTLADLAARPRSAYVADLVGVNLLRGVADGNRIHLDQGGEITAADAGRGAVLAVVHPRSVAVHRTAPGGSPRNAWPVRIESIEPLGDRVRLRLSGPPALVAEVTPGALSELGLTEGGAAWVAVKATDVRVSAA